MLIDVVNKSFVICCDIKMFELLSADAHSNFDYFVLFSVRAQYFQALCIFDMC